MRVACIIFFAAITLISCTKVENNYFYCISYDENGKCIEWAEMDTDPRVDGEIPDNTKDADSGTNDLDEDIKNPNEDKMAENEVDNDFENEDFDFYEELPDPDYDMPEIPDEDMCEDPCFLLYEKYDGYYGKDKENGKRIRLWIVKDECRCEGQMILTDEGIRESFFGYFFPLVSDKTSNKLELGSNDREIVLVNFADSKKRYFEEIQ